MANTPDEELARFLGEIEEVAAQAPLQQLQGEVQGLPVPVPADAPSFDIDEAPVVIAVGGGHRAADLAERSSVGPATIPVAPAPSAESISERLRRLQQQPRGCGAAAAAGAAAAPGGGRSAAAGAPAYPGAAAAASSHWAQKEQRQKADRTLRVHDGVVWQDPSMREWPENDHRLFCGNLGNDVNGDILGKTFAKYDGFLKAKVVRDKKTLKSRGYGFVSFRSADEALRAQREMNGKYIGNRPVAIRQSTWDERQAVEREDWQEKRGKQLKKRNRKYHYGGEVEPPLYEPY
eukprot:TRINITY_DN60998_c0_g1_i1.p1 TRINITY_DN60998_c0_g1~~TRINITY_DN60998_c0_g1_i1.p1  ORF type:complete len:291 (+),score=110.42 TRINITY_DN60998_c0_g1_i1:100-972(+)